MKEKAKMVGVKAGTYDDTFVTGGGLPGRNRVIEENSDHDPELDEIEDQLLGKASQYEKDFNKMMTKLTEIDDMMSGNDLKYIKEMMDYSQQSLNGHTVGFAKLRERVSEMGDDVFKEIELAAKLIGDKQH